MVEIIEAEQNKAKRMNRGLRKKEKKKGYEKILEETVFKKSSNTRKEITTQVQEAQRVLCRINPKTNTPRHILIKLMKIKHKE